MVTKPMKLDQSPIHTTAGSAVFISFLRLAETNRYFIFITVVNTSFTAEVWPFQASANKTSSSKTKIPSGESFAHLLLHRAQMLIIE